MKKSFYAIVAFFVLLEIFFMYLIWEEAGFIGVFLVILFVCYVFGECAECSHKNPKKP